MSAESTPITIERFKEALTELPQSSLVLKLMEIRNSIVHLRASNEQLRPYAEGKAVVGATEEQGQQQTGAQVGEPDQDCIDAITENEEVIARMKERIRVIKTEVENRGMLWADVSSAAGDPVEDDEPAGQSAPEATNGISL